MRKFLIAVVLLLGITFLISHFAEIEAVVDTFQRGDWRYLLVALLLQFAWLVNIAASYRAIYRALGMKESIDRLLLQAVAANFVNVIAPSVGVGGVTVFISEARKRGHSAVKATLGSVLFVVFEYLGFSSVMVIGIIVLIRRNNLHAPEISASIILFSLTGVFSLLFYLGLRSAQSMGEVLAWMARQVNWLLRPFLKRDYLSEARAYEFAADAAEGLSKLRENPEHLAWPAALSLSNKALMLSIFFFIFLAFKVPFSPGTLIAGFSIAYLFTIVSPTPAGIGVVEGMLTLALRSMYIPLGASAVITMAYRGVTFWIPLLYGMIALRFLGQKQQPTSSEE